MKVVINPKYEYLRDWIEFMPSFFKREGHVIDDDRNTIKTFLLENEVEVNVKRYHKPHFFNRVIYTFFRKSKAFRAYYNALRIIEQGFDTADPIAYIIVNKNGLLSDSYFVSIQCRNVTEIRKYCYGSLPGNEKLIDAFARYSAALHDAGIYHLDYSPGNILIRNTARQYFFILVDINRMKFMRVSPEAGCRNFSRLFRDDGICERIGSVYAQSRQMPFDKGMAIRLILKYKHRFFRKKARKDRIKKILK